AELHEGSKRDVDALLRKIDALAAQLALSAALAESVKLAEQGKVAEALAALDRAGEVAQADPRAGRQRVLLLLRLERFDEADAVVARLEASGDSRARETVERYPELRFRFQLSLANRLIRSGKPPRELLAAMKPATPEQALE